ncbi:MAG: DUF423 domain-containing protein [Reichenbachiella sp.]|uniref:DUF423 domain-containing protein n=1 Tax=Reichenbachiella sp. TaxID=2184521 RepID=UPI0032974471
MNRNALLLGAGLGMLSVMIGAFGAHGLKDILIANERVEVFETAVKYQFYHAFALLIAGILAGNLQGQWMKKAVYCFSIGVFIFSGSLYILSLTNIGWLGAITPIGGIFLIGGWVSLLIGVYKQKESEL